MRSAATFKITVLFALAFCLTFAALLSSGCGEEPGTLNSGSVSSASSSSSTSSGGLPQIPGAFEPDFDIAAPIEPGTPLFIDYDGEADVTYQWYKGGEPIEGETESTFTPDEPGVYSVVISSDGYEDTTIGLFTVGEPSGSSVSSGGSESRRCGCYR